jgi:hypothetical protein
MSHQCSAEGGGGCAEGGSEWAGVAEALGGGRCSIGSPPQCMGPGPARAGLGGGTRGTAAQAFKGRRLDPVNSLGEVPPPRPLSMES